MQANKEVPSLTLAPLLSIVIVAYKNKEILSSCLDSIKKHNDIGNRLEIIVVDNTPNGDVADALCEAFSGVFFIKNPRNGFGFANNIGAKNSNANYLLFLNPDTVLVEPIFQFALERFNADDSLGLFGVKLVDESLRSNMSFYLIDINGFFGAQIVKVCNAMNLYIDGFMYIAGADMFIRKDVFFKCGMFDEGIFMYYEEPDISKRIKIAGFRTSFFPSKKIIHLEGQCTDGGDFSIQERMKSLRYYCGKYRMDFRRYMKNDIRYSFFKLFCYFLFKKSETIKLKREISIMRKFLESYQ